MKFSSRLIEQAVEAFADLPGIGRKTALRLVLHLVNQDAEKSEHFAKSIREMRAGIRFCKNCHNLSDDTLCEVCTNPRRDSSIICVVESIRDVMAIEDTGLFQGLYHVLGGLIIPIEGIGPEALHIDKLVERAKENEVNEVIFAISPTIDGETTMFYLSKQLAGCNVSISHIARGVSFGGELQYADEVTLGRSIASRLKYQG